MDIRSIVEQLAFTNNLEDWAEKATGLNRQQREDAFEAAQPRWVERMIMEGKLLLHPDVVIELKSSNWVPNHKHQKMIWASILASLDGPTSKDDFRRIKTKLITKHGNKWWHDVYKRIKPVYAAKERIAKQCQNAGPGLQMLAQNSIFIAGAVHAAHQEALKMIPKN